MDILAAIASGAIVVKSGVIHFTKNEIDVIYLQLRNTNQFYMPFLSSPPISIEDWRDNELARIAA